MLPFFAVRSTVLAMIAPSAGAPAFRTEPPAVTVTRPLAALTEPRRLASAFSTVRAIFPFSDVRRPKMLSPLTAIRMSPPETTSSKSAESAAMLTFSPAFMLPAVRLPAASIFISPPEPIKSATMSPRRDTRVTLPSAVAPLTSRSFSAVISKSPPARRLFAKRLPAPLTLTLPPAVASFKARSAAEVISISRPALTPSKTAERTLFR